MSPDSARQRARSISPTDSGRASPALGTRVSRRQIEEDPRLADKTYRRYATGIERSLALFDAARLEWPDYISFLGRLLKAVQAHPPSVDTVPHQHSVSNRLAQCLSPNLPSGVHQKALEAYKFIFSLLGKHGLARELSVYLPGLLPVLSFASLAIRPLFLELLEAHVLALDVTALRPAIKALLLCLLPGLEDETSEEFDRTLRCVDRLHHTEGFHSVDHGTHKSAPGSEYFWQCLFLATLSSPSRRHGSLAYLSRRLPKLGPQQDMLNGASNGAPEVNDLLGGAESVISPEPGLLIRCFASGLTDEQLLLQRGFLDLLLSHLPLNSPVLTQRVDADDLQRLVSAAISVVARRDMSLNRRLWAWFLGPTASDDDAEKTPTATPITTPTIDVAISGDANAFFAKYGMEPLTRSILAMLNRSITNSTDQARPYRICLSLMDRWEIGGLLVPRIFLPGIDSLYAFKQVAVPSDFQDALRSANSFFDGIESGIIWGQMKEIISAALGPSSLDSSDRQQKINLVRFIVSNFHVREEEMITFHMPIISLWALIHVVLLGASEPSHRTGCDGHVVEKSLRVVEQLLSFMPERNHLNASFGNVSTVEQGEGNFEVNVRNSIDSFYKNYGGNLALNPPPFSSYATVNLILKYSADILCEHLRLADSYIIAGTCARTLSSVLRKIPDAKSLDSDLLITGLATVIDQWDEDPSEARFSQLTSIQQVLVALWTKNVQDHMTISLLQDLLVRLVEQLLGFLEPNMPKYHVEAVRSLWQLDGMRSGDQLLESAITRFISQNTYSGHSRDSRTSNVVHKFAVLWTHSVQSVPTTLKTSNSISRRRTSASASQAQVEISRLDVLSQPLFLFLDALSSDSSESRYFLSKWLGSLPGIHAFILGLMNKISRLERNGLLKVGTLPAENLQFMNRDQSLECLYYMQHIVNILGLATENVLSALSESSFDQISGEDESNETIQISLARMSLRLIHGSLQSQAPSDDAHASFTRMEIQRHALQILQQLLHSPYCFSMKPLAVDDHLTDVLTESLSKTFRQPSIISMLLDTTLGFLKLRQSQNIPSQEGPHRRNSSIDTIRSFANRGLKHEPRGSALQNGNLPVQLLKKLLKCLLDGVKSACCIDTIEKWMHFLVEILPLFTMNFFQHLMPIVETLCARIKVHFEALRSIFMAGSVYCDEAPEPILMSLLNGLEYVLSAAHERLAFEERTEGALKSPEQPTQGIFGNITSGVFSSELPKGRAASANSRLTVILCLQDSIRVCYSIWEWGSFGQDVADFDQDSSASFAFTSARIRSKARKLLDRSFVAETLESLETLITAWRQQYLGKDSAVINLLHVLDGSRPKRAIPALFNAIYSRTNPTALEGPQKSSLTSELTELDLGEFLIAYAESLDDDAMDEIWIDCMTFLKDVLSNPLSHSPVLPALIVFLLTLAEKIENTNFGEQRKMRKELSDIFQRLLTATFTSKPATALQESPNTSTGPPIPTDKASIEQPAKHSIREASVIDVLGRNLDRLPFVLSEPDRIGGVASTISSHAVMPFIQSKSFPENVGSGWFQLVQKLMRIPQASKSWKRDASDIFNHPRLFSCPQDLPQKYLLPTLQSWARSDKDRMPEVLGRISSPTSAGIMFGVGASAARLDTDKKTQLNLRRIALLVLALEDDAIATNIAPIEEKIVDLLHATPASSPSSATRAEVFMVLRAIFLKTAAVHVAPIWPMVLSEMQKALLSVLPRSKDYDNYNTVSLLQACRLLDFLLFLGTDDFQMHEWLFITDTIDAVYRPEDWEPVGLVDELAEEMSANINLHSPRPTQAPFNEGGHDRPSVGRKATLIDSDKNVMDMGKEDFVRTVLTPFFAQLSIHNFETIYSMAKPNVAEYQEGLLSDLFNDTTLIG